ncbi:MAG TPA: M20/M25/M40 family metallo-hydrolase [Thermoleophilaceae bacterium]|nr:M20/M25/M40 family metallo-hydrolase [Thermoleophilaceae bacterium]
MDSTLHERPAELLSRLIRFDTTNPPGAERECLAFVDGLLREAGIETRTVAKDPARPNLIARLPGAGKAPPLLLQGHVDVVTTEGQDWSHPPFGGETADGFVWGRGALDMKGAVAMMTASVLRAKANGVEPPGDVVLCLMSDEEAGSDLGARFLVEEHPELFEGIRFAIGEFGGFNLDSGGTRLYPIMVAEKLNCWLRLTIRGPAGHASMPVRGGAMAELSRILRKLDRGRLPVHVTPVSRRMVRAIAEHSPPPARLLLEGLLRTPLTDRVIGLMGERGKLFDPLLHNTASPTVVRAGAEINVIPSEVTLDLDCRLLPGFEPGQAIAELRALIGDSAEIEIVRADPVAPEADLALFPVLAGILAEADPGAHAIPNLLPAVTDGRFFARLGIQTYGFTPMRLPEGMSFTSLIHAADERIPVDAIEFGTAAIRKLLERFG